MFGCKHKKYKIIKCERKEKYYVVECLKCHQTLTLPKAEGEMYEVGTIIIK